MEVTRTVDRFEIVGRIGRGGMAVVHLARQRGLEREIALKELMSFDPAHDSSLARRFLHEARTAGALGHPNIVTVFDYVEQDGTPYIAMEYLPRGSLRPLIGNLTLAQAAGVLEGLLSGLDHAGRRGVVHRDLKPENLLVTDEGTVKIADLGIAKAYNRVSLGLTATGMAIGTPAYMAPEQAMGQDVDPRTDLYASGVIAYEVLLGRVPFVQTDAPLAVLWKHINEQPPAARSIDPNLDPRLEGWLNWMLEKSPDNRPARALEALDALEEIVVDLLGWRWRQHARLGVGEVQEGPSKTPASAIFQSAPHPAPLPEAEGPVPPVVSPADPVSPTPPSPAAPVAPPVAPTADPTPVELAPTVAPEPLGPAPTLAPAADVPRAPPRARRAVLTTTAFERLTAARPRLTPAARTAIALLALLVVLGGAGFALGRRDGGERVVETTLVPVSWGDVRLSIPSDWRRRPAPVLPGLPLRESLFGGPGGSATARLGVGTVEAGPPTFLPQSFASRLRPGALAREERVRLRRVQAYRHSQLLPRGWSQTTTLFVVPVADGSAVVLACLADRADVRARAALSSCGRVAATVELPERDVPDIVPTRRYVSVVRSALTRLGAARGSALARLRSAKRRAGQASAAETLARAHAAAAVAVRGAPLNPVTRQPTLELARAFEKCARTFSRLQAAARSGNRGSYSRALHALRSSDVALQRALVRLRGHL